MKKLNIQVFVDVLAMMTGSPIEKTVFIYDDSASSSTGKGTYQTVSATYPGQLIQWNLYPVDVQTQVWLGGITFGPQVLEAEMIAPADSIALPDAAESSVCVGQDVVGSETPWLYTWTGYAPLYMWPNYKYPYTLHLQFGITGKTVRVNGPKLVFPTFCAIAPIGESSVL